MLVLLWYSRETYQPTPSTFNIENEKCLQQLYLNQNLDLLPRDPLIILVPVTLAE